MWRARFGLGTPAEITAAFTAVLAAGLRTRHRDYLVGGPRHRPGTPASVLADRGWRPEPGPKGFHDQVAPDQTAVYRHRLGHQSHDAEAAGRTPPTWSMLAGDPTAPSWRAEFTIGVPFYALVNATLAFSDPAPGQRPSIRARVRQAPNGPTAASTASVSRPAPAAARRR